MMVQAGVLSSVALISGNIGFVEKLGKPSTKLEEFWQPNKLNSAWEIGLISATKHKNIANKFNK